MRVFISWSGSRSKQFADAIHPWLRRVMNNVDPWLSKHNLPVGSKWHIELTGQLENTDAGIICLTRENLTKPWILFEAGALSKKEESRVMPLMLDGSVKEIDPPLSNFQAAFADKEGIYATVRSVNNLLGKAGHDPEELRIIFDMWWPNLKEQIKAIPETEAPAPEPPKLDDVVLRLSGQVAALTQRISRSDLASPLDRYSSQIAELQTELSYQRDRLTSTVAQKKNLLSHYEADPTDETISREIDYYDNAIENVQQRITDINSEIKALTIRNSS